MTVFVARQPILDRSRRTCAYELLYRSGPDSGCDAPDADRATLGVIDTSFHVVGLETLTGRRRAFVNFTRDTLLKGYATSLPRECLVVEVLENVAPDAEVLEACRGLKAAGYPVALDDVITADLPGVLVDLADIVKVDFRLTDRATRSHITRAFRGRGIRLLAEKVETETEFRQAHADDYELFQGYFFARPNVVSGRAIPAVKQNLLRLLHEAHRPDPNRRHFEEIIRQDMAIAFKLLAHLRGAASGQRRPVDSVRSAFLLLGDRGIRKWASIVAIATLGQDRPPELVVGLFSTIDAFLDLPLREALDRLALDDTVSAALLGGGHALRSVLDLALAYERGDWTDVSRLAGVVGVADPDVVFLAALLHDLGLLVLTSHYPKDYEALREASASEGRPLIDVEVAVLGTDHATMGAQLAKQWLFPPSVCAAIRGHHRIGTVEPEHRWNTLVVHLAESLASEAKINGLDEGVTLVPDDPGLAELGITPDALPVLVVEAQQEAERAGNLLDAA